jgi:hypothetical protein
VIKYLGTAIHRVDYGKLSKDDYEAVESLLKNLVYSASRDEYASHKDSLKAFCEKAGFSGFYDYFLRNWDSCKEMWVMCERANLPHFRNHTNNRLENWFGKFKKGVKPSSTMANCVTELLNGARRSARKREFSKRIGRDYNANFDEEMNRVLLFTTHFVASQVLPEYSRALAKWHDYSYVYPNGPDGQCVNVTGRTKTHSVDLTDFSCTCEFALSMRLPCRHAMAFRKHKGGSSVIPLQRIDDRYVACCVHVSYMVTMFGTWNHSRWFCCSRFLGGDTRHM